MAPVLVECSFLIPVRRDALLSDGQPHAKRVWTWLERELFLFGGMTRAPGLYEGGYLDPDTGRPVLDRSRKYFVAVSRARVDELRRLLRKACRKFEQKCLYLSVGGRVEFVEGEDDAPA